MTDLTLFEVRAHELGKLYDAAITAAKAATEKPGLAIKWLELGLKCLNAAPTVLEIGKGDDDSGFIKQFLEGMAYQGEDGEGSEDGDNEA